MHWIDEGIIIGTRRHGETSLIVELMTEGHGRHLGLVRGGRSRTQRPVLQAGNSVTATWRARLDEHLGNYAVEPAIFRAAKLMESPAGLYGLQALAGLVRLLPERDPHPQIYTALDLESCVATGTNDDLAYVSPKSGRAVSRSAGDPYRERMLQLPAFLLGAHGARPAAEDLLAAFRLTGFFLARHVYEPRGMEPPEARERFVGLLGR